MEGILLGLMMFVVVIAAKLFFSAPFRAMLMSRSERVDIASAEDGAEVRIVGEVEALETTEAPLSGRECVYWHVVVRERSKSQGQIQLGNWAELINAHGGGDFLVVDSTGTARVDTSRAVALLDLDSRYESSWNVDPTPTLKAFVESRGHSTEGLLTNKRLAYLEGIVEVGESVGVTGTASFEPDPDPEARKQGGYRGAAPPERLVLGSGEGGLLKISDLESAKE